MRRYLDRAGAEVGRSLLESCGIGARIAADNEGGMAPHLTYVTGVRLLVADHDAETAQSILTASELEAASPRALLMDAADQVPRLGPADTAYKAALAGLMVFPVGLHLYSLWYAVVALRGKAALTDRSRRRLRTALLVDLGVLAVAAAVAAWMLSRGRR